MRNKALKVYAATQNKPISEVIEEALSQYHKRWKYSVVIEKPIGSMKIDPESPEEILEDYYDQRD